MRESNARPTLLTIGTCNRRAGIAVVAESFLEHHPDGRVFICLVDRPSPQMPALDLPGHTFYADELSLPGTRRFLFKYDAFELCCALKPYAIRHVCQSYGPSRLVYLDSDILVTNHFWQELESGWSDKFVLLTPHLIRLPSELDPQFQRSLVQHGEYNGGFIALKFDQETDQFLNWWATLLENLCTFDPMNNIYVDQRWLDLFAASSPAAGVLRDPGFNVGYWNLHERNLKENPDATWSVNGQPLRFFHFSGFDRQTLTTKINCPDPMGRKIAAQYGCLLEKAGENQFGSFQYGWDRYANGDLIPTVHRDLILAGDPQFGGITDPFSLPDKPKEWREIQQLGAVAQPVRITQNYLRLEKALGESQKELGDSQEHLAAATATLRRLYQHPVIGLAWRLWARYVNASLALDSDVLNDRP